MFETFEESGTFFVQGNVFVIAILDRDTLRLKDYVDRAFVTKDDAADALYSMDEDKDLAYIIQEKQIMIPIHKSDA